MNGAEKKMWEKLCEARDKIKRKLKKTKWKKQRQRQETSTYVWLQFCTVEMCSIIALFVFLIFPFALHRFRSLLASFFFWCDFFLFVQHYTEHFFHVVVFRRLVGWSEENEYVARKMEKLRMALEVQRFSPFRWYFIVVRWRIDCPAAYELEISCSFCIVSAFLDGSIICLAYMSSLVCFLSMEHFSISLGFHVVSLFRLSYSNNDEYMWNYSWFSMHMTRRKVQWKNTENDIEKGYLYPVCSKTFCYTNVS